VVLETGTCRAPDGAGGGALPGFRQPWRARPARLGGCRSNRAQRAVEPRAVWCSRFERRLAAASGGIRGVFRDPPEAPSRLRKF
jgi:hypothetical protein